MATTVQFQHAIGRVFFDGGMTDDGKMIRKSKTYRNVKENAPAANLYNALEQLAELSDVPFIEAEIVETSSLIN
ncbi:DUF1659 domain-containing protein [Sporosarcina siberiensis]|uniref:DUF1659 domain-containing protein n=1 Tax=Sporosarcina siberiensis TaxID=1365606 RepID=A0ABW4SE66_9BACL